MVDGFGRRLPVEEGSGWLTLGLLPLRILALVVFLLTALLALVSLLTFLFLSLLTSFLVMVALAVSLVVGQSALRASFSPLFPVLYV